MKKRIKFIIFAVGLMLPNVIEEPPLPIDWTALNSPDPLDVRPHKFDSTYIP